MYQSQDLPGTFKNNIYAVAQEVWGLEDIASFLNISLAAARRLVNEPRFPGPIANQSRNRRWFADEVKVFLRARSRGEVAPLAKAAPNSNYIPKTIRTRPLKVVNL
jgi:hypothetical protein